MRLPRGSLVVLLLTSVISPAPVGARPAARPARPARPVETYDVTTFTPPAGWTRTEQPGTSIGFKTERPAAGSACEVVVLRSVPGGKDARANFDMAWDHFVKPTVPDAGPPTLAPAAALAGWDLVRGRSTFTFGGNAGAVTILTATGGRAAAAPLVIVVATSIGGACEGELTAFLGSLRFATATPATPPAVPAAPAPAAPAPAPAAPVGASPGSVAAALTGTWAFSTGGAMWNSPYAPWLSDRREYTFDGKGGYAFLRRRDVSNEPETTLVREAGTYALAGDALTLTPRTSTVDTWAKRGDGAYDKKLKTEPHAREIVTFRVELTTYLDTGVPNVMLTPPASTLRDGPFNATTAYRLFRPDGSYYTSIVQPR